MRKVSKPIVAVFILLVALFTNVQTSNAASNSQSAIKLVEDAERYATSLKWEISLEYRKKVYPKDPISYPKMDIYNSVKKAQDKAQHAIQSLPKTQKEQLQKRLQSNVTVQLTRAQAYIDAITSGKKIIQKEQTLSSWYSVNPASNQAEKAFHDLSTEIRKQALLLYRVYGQSTRDAILDKYKVPGETTREKTKYAITAKMEIDNLVDLLLEEADQVEITNKLASIESLLDSIESPKVYSVLEQKYERVLTTNASTVRLKEIITHEKSVVMILSYDSSNKLISQGSGFVVGPSTIMTNAHVVEGGTRFEAITNFGQTIQIQGVVKYDKALDAALLKTTKPHSMESLTLGTISNVEKGDSIVTIGSPEGLLNTVSTGIVSGLRDDENEGTTRRVIQITAPITFGSSGGPLLSINGDVLGINTFGYETGNLNFAVAIDHVKPWITETNNKAHAAITVLPVSALK
ncbi:trypsin-like peptidase domain-containing protein [Fredinandcohnia humi]